MEGNGFIGRWGGKHYSRNKILSYIPDNYDTYVEPFVGGGSVYLNLEKNGKEIINIKMEIMTSNILFINFL